MSYDLKGLKDLYDQCCGRLDAIQGYYAAETEAAAKGDIQGLTGLQDRQRQCQADLTALATHLGLFSRTLDSVRQAPDTVPENSGQVDLWASQLDESLKKVLSMAQAGRKTVAALKHDTFESVQLLQTIRRSYVKRANKGSVKGMLIDQEG